MFSALLERETKSSATLILLSANAFNLNQSKILLRGLYYAFDWNSVLKLTVYCELINVHSLNGRSYLWVLRGSVVKCLTRNPRVLDSSRTGSSGFFRGSVHGQDTSEPSLVLVKSRKDVNNVSCRRDMTEIMLKAA